VGTGQWAKVTSRHTWVITGREITWGHNGLRTASSSWRPAEVIELTVPAGSANALVGGPIRYREAKPVARIVNFR